MQRAHRSSRRLVNSYPRALTPPPRLLWATLSDTDCLISTVGVAAKLSVKEEDRGRLQFVPWEPFPRRVKAKASEKVEGVPEVAPDAEKSLYDSTRRKAA
jgi:hypothetical protein